MSANACESWGMPISAGTHCQHCVDEAGKLQPFGERFERMVQWQARRTPESPRAEVEQKTLEYMGRLPAWKDDPELLARLSSR